MWETLFLIVKNEIKPSPANTKTEKEKHEKTKTSEFERDGDTYRETFQRISPPGIYSPCQLWSEQTGKQEGRREKKPVGARGVTTAVR